MSQTRSTQMAEIEKFKSAIPRVRDILRSCSITGMDSMRHICFYLLSRYITNENVDGLGISQKLSWEKIYLKSFEDEDVALQLFKIDLIDQFDKLFGTQQFSFEVKNGIKHKEILEIFNNISMEDIDLHMDILGYVYEQHLKTGSTAARDLGQFFTDRFICEYMVKICQPKLKHGGIPESVCDPTMGTGGFLTAYLKYFKDIDWSKYQNQIHGVDHDAKVAGVSRLNMFMESRGQLFKHLHTADSLHGGLNPTTYDIILANMPFGLKGLKYADVHQSIKALGLNGTKSEPLFLQLMMVSLNKGGRCAVVVPDGMLVNNSKCHNGTRKYLLDNFELKRVIKMKGKFFMNTGIQPSILFFENSGKKTGQVEFWDVERDDKGNFTEKVVISVPVDKFDESYSLDMRKYQETEKIVYDNDIQSIKLGDLITATKGKIQATKCDNGEWPVVSISDKRTHSEYTVDGENIFIASTNAGSAGNGKFGTVIKYYNGKCNFTNLMHNLKIKDKEILLYKYLYYILQKFQKIIEEKCEKGTCNKTMDINVLLEIEIPIPSLEVQNQIVEELDTIYESKQNASNMIANLKKQMKSIVNTLKYKSYEEKSASDIGELCRNNTDIVDDENGEYIKYFGPKVVGKTSNYHFDGEYILTPNRQTIGTFGYVNSKFTSTHTFVYKVNRDNITKYIYYYLKFDNKLAEKTKGVIPYIRNDDLLSLSIIIPPLDVQMDIVKRLDMLDEQVKILEMIEKNADENAKFVLDGYLGV